MKTVQYIVDMPGQPVCGHETLGSLLGSLIENVINELDGKDNHTGFVIVISKETTEE